MRKLTSRQQTALVSVGEANLSGRGGTKYGAQRDLFFQKFIKTGLGDKFINRAYDSYNAFFLLQNLAKKGLMSRVGTKYYLTQEGFEHFDLAVK